MPPDSPAIGRPWTVTATPAFAVAKMLVNVALMVSVRMKVPATNDTPRMTAIVVSASRSLCESRLRRLMPSTRQPCTRRSVTKVAHDVEHAVGGRSVHLAHDATVRKEDDAIRVRRGERIVSDHDDRLPQLGDGVLKKVEEIRARAGVEVAGGLVGEDDLRPARECPRRGDALLLSSGELIGTVFEAVAETGDAHHLGKRGRVRLLSSDGQRQHDVVERRERRD